MENVNTTVALEYNTEREKLQMPEYGRNVLKMVEHVKSIEDRDERTRQAYAVVKVMELLNPQARYEENYEQKFWDHLFVMAGYDLDVDAPYPMPLPEARKEKPMQIPYKSKPIKATHYGRNIESIIELLGNEPDCDQKTAMLRSLATYMRQQYLIWNKDSVEDETIFKDIEKLSDYKIVIPDGLTLGKIASDVVLSRPGLNLDLGKQPRKQPNNQKRTYNKKANKR